nr:hypothetical protein [Tanacetum cinerariifolium]
MALVTFRVLYGDVNGKRFAIDMLKQSLMSGLLGSLFFDAYPSAVFQFVGHAMSTREEKAARNTPNAKPYASVSKFRVLYGDVNGKRFAIDMLKQSLMSGLLGSLFFDGEQRVWQSGNDKIKESKKGMVLVTKLKAAVVVSRERTALEAIIKAICAS